MLSYSAGFVFSCYTVHAQLKGLQESTLCNEYKEKLCDDSKEKQRKVLIFHAQCSNLGVLLQVDFTAICKHEIELVEN